MEKGKKAQDNDHIVQVGNHAGNGELPFKAETQVHNNAQDHKEKCLQAVAEQFATHLWANKLNPAQFGIGVCLLQNLHDFFTLLGRRDALLDGKANHDIL